MIFLSACNIATDTSKLTADDYRLFLDTPIWELAKAVRDENVEEIQRLVKVKKVDMNYQDPKYGQTLLILAVMKHHYNSFKVLLELGADPNKHNTYNGSSAIIEAAGIEKFEGDNTQFLKLLLTHGANPNDEEIGIRQEGNTTRNTPLMKACSDVYEGVSPIGKVKMLVEAGANINYRNEYKSFALSLALLEHHYDVVLFLISKGAEYKQVISNTEGKDYYLWNELKFHLLPLDSKRYRQKMEIVDFLKQQGIDYRQLPIPEYAKSQAKKMYPNNWEEFLEKY